MPGERRNLRSNKETSSHTNGEKARPDAQNASSKDKPAPTRSTSSKGKSQISKKAIVNTASQDSNGDKPQLNGNDPLENGVNGNEDVEMGDDLEDTKKPNTSKDGDEEMTVVVPPPNSSKLSGQATRDDEGDVAMETSEKVEADGSEDKEVDPVRKAESGKCSSSNVEVISHWL